MATPKIDELLASANRHILERADKLQHRGQLLREQFEDQYKLEAERLSKLKEACVANEPSSIDVLMAISNVRHLLPEPLVGPFEIDFDSRVALCTIQIPDFRSFKNCKEARCVCSLVINSLRQSVKVTRSIILTNGICDISTKKQINGHRSNRLLNAIDSTTSLNVRPQLSLASRPAITATRNKTRLITPWISATTVPSALRQRDFKAGIPHDRTFAFQQRLEVLTVEKRFLPEYRRQPARRRRRSQMACRWCPLRMRTKSCRADQKSAHSVQLAAPKGSPFRITERSA